MLRLIAFHRLFRDRTLQIFIISLTDRDKYVHSAFFTLEASDRHRYRHHDRDRYRVYVFSASLTLAIFTLPLKNCGVVKI